MNNSELPIPSKDVPKTMTNEITHLLEETGHPDRASETDEEVLVCMFSDALHAKWENMIPGVDTSYTFVGYLAEQLMHARELLAKR